MIDPVRIGSVFLTAVLALAVLLTMERCAGERDARIEAKEREVVALAKRFHVERVRADSLEAVARRSVVAAVAAAAPAARAQARTDSALQALSFETARARKLAADSAAREVELREGLTRMADRADRAQAAFLVERDSSAARLTRWISASGQLVTAIDAKNAAIEAAQNLEKNHSALVAALKRARPGVVHRGFVGLVTGSASVTCSVVGYVVAGPVGGLVGGAGCAILAGVVIK